MKYPNLKATIGLAACLLAVPAMYASTTINMTGCLARGARAHQYTATDSLGENYGLMAEAGTGVNMKKHVGQEVMVTGTVVKGAKARREAVRSGTPSDDQYLRVDQIKEVRPSCK